MHEMLSQPIVSGLLTASLIGSWTAFCGWFRKSKEKQDTLETAVSLILMKDMENIYKDCAKHEGSTDFERFLFHKMYAQFKKLGGNGAMENTKELFDELSHI